MFRGLCSRQQTKLTGPMHDLCLVKWWLSDGPEPNARAGKEGGAPNPRHPTLTTACYDGQPAPGSGWSVRRTSGGVSAGRRYQAKRTRSVVPLFLAR